MPLVTQNEPLITHLWTGRLKIASFNEWTLSVQLCLTTMMPIPPASVLFVRSEV